MKAETELKIKLIRKVLINKLELGSYMTKDEFIDFCIKFTNNLIYNRNSNILSYSIEELEITINKMINFFDNLGLSKKDIIEALKKNYSFIDLFLDKDFLDKYILLSVLENDENTIRKNILLNDSKRIKISLEEMYARYVMTKLANREICYSNLARETYSIFVKSLIRNTYYKNDSKILNRFKNLEQICKLYPVDYNFINKLKQEKINSNVSFNNKLSKQEKINIVLNNYYKVSNIRELSELVNISTSSIQRYLKEAKDYVSESEYQRIKLWLQNAKSEGLSRGGINSQLNNGYTKDEEGKFNGNKRR